MQRVFQHMVDYAGLFPPASLAMDAAVRAYAEYRAGPDREMLGRFVVAGTRLAELDATVIATGTMIPPDDPWPLSVVLGVHIPDGLQVIADFQSESQAPLEVQAIELRVNSVGQVMLLAEQLPPRWERYLEVPHIDSYGPLLEAIGRAGMGAKIRTGGTTAEYFPSVHQLTRFLMAAIRVGVPFKATAGLHHPFRGSYPLTYERDSDQHRMFGFVNLLMAAALLRQGAEGEVAERVLREESRRAFVWSDDALTWRGTRVPFTELAAVRAAFRNFGCCSFREPVDELAASRA
jgi:hypothetical protein